MDGAIEVIDRLMRQVWPVLLLLVFYFLANIAVRLSLPQSLEMDEGQQLFLAQWLAAGYDSQPPFYNWLQYGAVQIFGNTVLALTLLKNVLLLGCYLLFGMAARLVIADRRLAAIAMLGLITIPQISFEAQRDLSHTVAVLFSACLFIYAFLKTLKQPTASSYALTGAAIGFGMLSKYNFALLPLAAALAILPDRRYRSRLTDPRLIVTAVIAAVIIAPHALWFIDNLDTATARTLGKLAQGDGSTRLQRIGEGLASLFGSIAVFFLPTVILFWIAFGNRLSSAWSATNEWTRLVGRMFVILTIALTALVIFGGASLIKARWLIPFFFLLPLYLGLKIDASGGEIGAATRRFGLIALLIMLLIPLALFIRVAAPDATGHYEKLNVPYGPAINAIIASGSNRPAIIAAEDLQLAGNIRLHAPDIAVVVPGYERFQQSHAFDGAHPVLLIWRNKGIAAPALPEALAAWLRKQPGMGEARPAAADIARPYHYGYDGALYHFSYAWIYPAP